MANEAVVIELTNSTGFPRTCTCASGTSITKGTLLTLSDPNTVAACTASAAIIAGIAAADKDGTDYSTTISVWTSGIFDMLASGAIGIGAPICSASDAAVRNSIKSANGVSAASGGAILGVAEEAA